MRNDDSAPLKGNAATTRWVLVPIVLILGGFATLIEFPGLRDHMKQLQGVREEALLEPPPAGTTVDDPGDDPTCLSRTQHLLMRNASSIFNLPPALSSALRAHEEMQARCLQGNMSAKVSGLQDPDDECKYIVFLNNEGFGLGNHILSLISAFLYSLVTNRTLLVDSRGHLSKLLCEPFPNSSWLLPPGFPYSHIQNAPPLGSAIKQDFRFGHVVHLMLLHQQSPEDQQFFCEETQAKLSNVTWLGWSSSQYFVPRLFVHPSFTIALLPDTSLVFTHLSRYLLLPQNEIWGRISRAYSAYLSQGATTKVGLQIRLHHTKDPAGFDARAHERIMRCLIGNTILPSVSEGDRLITQTSQPMVGRLTKVFIASLQVKFYEEMKKTYVKLPTTDGSLVQVHTLSHDGEQSASFDQAVDAFVEMWLLSFSDVLVTSSWSTFGYVAQGLGALRPYVLNIRGEDLAETSKSTPCFRAQSIEPCNHFPFLRPPCKKNQTTYMEQSQWFKEHILHCQDESRGIQLV